MAVEVGAVLIDIFMAIAVVVGLLAIAMLARALFTEFRPRRARRANGARRVAQVHSLAPGRESSGKPPRQAAAG